MSLSGARVAHRFALAWVYGMSTVLHFLGMPIALTRDGKATLAMGNETSAKNEFAFLDFTHAFSMVIACGCVGFSDGG